MHHHAPHPLCHLFICGTNVPLATPSSMLLTSNLPTIYHPPSPAAYPATHPSHTQSSTCHLTSIYMLPAHSMCYPPSVCHLPTLTTAPIHIPLSTGHPRSPCTSLSMLAPTFHQCLPYPSIPPSPTFADPRSVLCCSHPHPFH